VSPCRIWRFQLNRQVTINLLTTVPAGAEFISAGFSDGQLSAWAIVNPNHGTDPRCIYVIGTGQPLPEGSLRHLGTVNDPDGFHIWHIFEEDTT
jgi:hypothetical protein